MGKNRISDFLESIDSEKWNCVYQANGMTLLTTKEYNYRYEERVNLKNQLKKQKEVIDKAVKYIDDLRDESAERQEFYNCFPDDLYIPDIDELLDILKEVSE